VLKCAQLFGQAKTATLTVWRALQGLCNLHIVYNPDSHPSSQDTSTPNQVWRALYSHAWYLLKNDKWISPTQPHFSPCLNAVSTTFDLQPSIIISHKTTQVAVINCSCPGTKRMTGSLPLPVTEAFCSDKRCPQNSPGQYLWKPWFCCCRWLRCEREKLLDG
jgi:hypothetical protein